MLEFKVLASGSKGNCYHVTDGETELLLEAGITFKEVQKLLNFQVSKLKAVLVTHEHMDHAKSVKTFLERGKDVYMTQGTKEALGISNYRLKTVTPLQTFRIGTFTILPFDTEHDVAEPCGFILKSDNGKSLLFMTDTYYCKYNFSAQRVNIFAVECNYNQAKIDENVALEKLHPTQRKRVMRSHMSLETLVEFFKVNDITACEDIYLLHLSSGNADREVIFNEVAKVTGKSITIVGG